MINESSQTVSCFDSWRPLHRHTQCFKINPNKTIKTTRLELSKNR
jgi:hypothetical protein